VGGELGDGRAHVLRVGEPGGWIQTVRLVGVEEGVRLTAQSSPWAEVRLDGRALGPTPTPAKTLRGGRHRLEFRAVDGRVRVVEVGVE